MVYVPNMDECVRCVGPLSASSHPLQAHIFFIVLAKPGRTTAVF